MLKEYNEYVKYISKDKSQNTINNYCASIKAMLSYFKIETIDDIKKFLLKEFCD